MVSSGADGIPAFDGFFGERDNNALPEVPNFGNGSDFVTVDDFQAEELQVSIPVPSIWQCDASSMRSDRDRTTNKQRLQKDTPTGRRSNRWRRARSKDYSQIEKNVFLELWEAYTPRLKGKQLWSSISRGMKKRGHDRSPKSCEYLAGTLQKTFKTIIDIDYHGMSVDVSTSYKPPKQFPREWYQTMKRILKKKEESKAKNKQSGTKSSGSPVQEPVGVEDSDDQSMQEPLAVEDSDDQSVQEPVEDGDDESMQEPLAVEDSDDQSMQDPLAVEGNGDQPLKQQSQLGEGLREEASKADPYQVANKILLMEKIEPIVSSRLRALQAYPEIDLKIAEVTTTASRIVSAHLREIKKHFKGSIDMEVQLGGLLQGWINDALDKCFEPIMAAPRRLEQKNEERRRLIEAEKRALDLKEKAQKRSARPRKAQLSQLLRTRN